VPGNPSRGSGAVLEALYETRSSHRFPGNDEGTSSKPVAEEATYRRQNQSLRAGGVNGGAGAEKGQKSLINQ
jgi:hypothetical protein